MTEWLNAFMAGLTLAILSVVSWLAMYNWRDNRWLASLFFILAVAFMLAAVPTFFGVRLALSWVNG